MGTSVRGGGLRGRTFAVWIGVIAAVVVVQSILHLVFTVDLHHRRSLFDLDRSNGIPDLVSTAALAAATLGAAVLTSYETGLRRIPPAIGVATFATLTLADLVHDGAHPTRNNGELVIAFAALTVAMVALIALTASTRARVTFAVGVGLLAFSFAVSQLKELDPTFDWRHGQRAHELRIVAKEGSELAGWALIGLGLWDLALLRRAEFLRLTAPASRAPVASRQRAV